MKIRFEEIKERKEIVLDEESLGFGKIFADYMLEMDYDPERQWHDPRIVPYHPLQLNPECMVFHYAQEIFEGLKAYRCDDGSVNLFRVDLNAERFYNSAVRMAIPPIDKEIFIECIKAYADKVRDWIPEKFGNSLYLRPFIIATDNGLGVHASKTYRFIVIASPSASYFASGLEPVDIYVEEKDIRSAPGLTGFAKCGGNYAISIKASEEAKENGYSQVLWLDGIEHKYVEEVGSMNIFFMIDKELYTADCTGTELPGITRQSILDICKEKNIRVHIGKLEIKDVMEAGKKGTLNEVFGCGTAAVISPVGKLTYKDESVIINEHRTGTFSKELFETLTSIQWGKIEDPYGWIIKI